MEQDVQLMLALRDTRPKVTQREVEIELGLSSGTIGDIKHKKIKVSPEDFSEILNAIKTLSEQKREAAACQSETMVSAAS